MPIVYPFGKRDLPKIGGQITSRQNKRGSGLKKAAGPVVPALTRGIIGSRFQVPTATASIPINYTSRRIHYASPDGDVSNFRTIDTHFSYVANTISPSDTRTIKRYIEYPVNVFTQVTWNGQPTVTINGSLAISDPINLTIPAGAAFWERTVNVNAVVSNFVCIQLPASSQTLGVPDGNAASDLGNSGTIGATSVTTTFGAAAMIGDIASATARSFVITGDSIAFGEGDITTAGAKYGSGWIARALDVYGYPYVKITKPGQMIQEFVSTPTMLIDFINALSFSDLIAEHGVNDLRLSRTQGQILGDQQTVYGWCAGKKITQTTITPRSSTTDAYATTVNQAAKTDGNMAALNPLNAAIRAKPANVTNVLEAADFAMSARDSGIWTAPPAATVDGTHPNSVKAASMATQAAPLI